MWDFHCDFIILPSWLPYYKTMQRSLWIASGFCASCPFLVPVVPLHALVCAIPAPLLGLFPLPKMLSLSIRACWNPSRRSPDFIRPGSFWRFPCHMLSRTVDVPLLSCTHFTLPVAGLRVYLLFHSPPCPVRPAGWDVWETGVLIVADLQGCLLMSVEWNHMQLVYNAFLLWVSGAPERKYPIPWQMPETPLPGKAFVSLQAAYQKGDQVSRSPGNIWIIDQASWPQRSKVCCIEMYTVYLNRYTVFHTQHWEGLQCNRQSSLGALEPACVQISCSSVWLNGSIFIKWVEQCRTCGWCSVNGVVVIVVVLLLLFPI